MQIASLERELVLKSSPVKGEDEEHIYEEPPEVITKPLAVLFFKMC
jgi:hypothetical protein